MDGPPTSAEDSTVPTSGERDPRQPADPHGGELRAFLFADIRGYTRFTRTQGAEAAAALLTVFNRLATDAVTAQQGRVRGSWGDEVLAEFGSARGAVRAAVTLQDSCAEATVQDPGLPLGVGIGMDAGEAAETALHSSGDVLNQAARLCARAKPGEILATAGLAHLAGTVPAVDYRRRGKVRLKGAGRVAVVEVRPAQADARRQAEVRRLLLGEHELRRSRHRRELVACLVVASLVLTVGAWWWTGRPAPASTVPGQSAGLIDSGSGGLIADAKVGQSPEGVVAGGGFVWVANTGVNTVNKIDENTRAVVQTVSVGAAPVALALAGPDVWVVNSGDSTVTEISTETDQPVGRAVGVGTQPSAITVGAGSVWVTNEGDGTVTRIDPHADPTGHHATMTFGVGTAPDGIAYGHDRLWVANRSDNTVTPVDPKTGGLGDPIHVGAGPRGVAVTRTAVWVTDTLDGTVSRIDPKTMAVSLKVPVGDYPTAVVGDSDTVWVSNSGDASVARIDSHDGQVLDRLDVGSSPHGLALTPAGLWVAAQAFPSRSHIGGTVRVEDALSIDDIDPAVSYSGGDSALVLVYDGLVGYHRDDNAFGYELVPDLALALPTPKNGGTTYSFTLRPGIRYSDGRKVNAGDIEHEIERELTIATAPVRTYYSGIVGASTCTSPASTCRLGIDVDNAAGTIVFHLSAPDPDFLNKLALPFAVAVPPSAPRQDVGTVPLAGTGPYMISQYEANKFANGNLVRPGSLTLVRNPHFHQWSTAAQPAGYPNEIRWLPADTDAHELAAVETGKADIVPVAGDEVAGVAGSFPAQLRTDLTVRTGFFVLNTSVRPFNNLAARQAVAGAFDRAVVTHLSPNGAAVSCVLVPPGYPGHTDICPYPTRDIAKTKTLVKNSGTAGQRVEVYFLDVPIFRRIGLYVTHVLNMIGYHARLHLEADYEWGLYDPVKRPMNIEGLQWFPDYPTVAAFYDPLLACRTWIRDSTSNLNGSQYCNHHVDTLVAKAQALRFNNPAQSASLWRQVYDDIVRDAPVIPTTVFGGHTMVSSRVGNYQSNPLWGVNLDQIWVR